MEFGNTYNNNQTNNNQFNINMFLNKPENNEYVDKIFDYYKDKYSKLTKLLNDEVENVEKDIINEYKLCKKNFLTLDSHNKTAQVEINR